MDVSTSSEGDVSSPLLDKYTLMPPTSMRPSKSVVAQVKETLFSFLRKTKDASSPKHENGNENGTGSSSPSEKSHSLSEKQRSEEAFLDRIATFKVPNWLGKPLALSPPLLAHYGWQCIGLDTVKCCSCSAIFSVRLPWPNADNYREQCLTYRQKVLTAHTKICSWPSYPCSDSFVSPFLHGGISSGEIREDFIKRKKNLLRLGDRLPQLERTILKELNLSEVQLQAIGNVQNEESDVINVANSDDNEKYYTRLSQHETAAVLSMCGWDTKSNVGSLSPSIFCKTSGRSVGLWNFYSFIEEKPSAEAEPASTSSEEPLLTSGSKRPSDPDQNESTTPKKARVVPESHTGSPSHMTIKKQFFHPQEQHHPWSSWIIVLKPISADEFDDDAVPGTNQDPDMKYKYVVTPSLSEKKAGWVVVRDTLLKKKYETEDDEVEATIVSVPPEDAGINTSDMEKLATMETAVKDPKSPPKAAILQVRKMTKEWSSPK